MVLGRLNERNGLSTRWRLKQLLQWKLRWQPVVKMPQAPFPPKEEERQLSKKELKKKELAELDAVLAELGFDKKETDGQDESHGLTLMVFASVGWLKLVSYAHTNYDVQALSKSRDKYINSSVQDSQHLKGNLLYAVERVLKLPVLTLYV
ncbi:hypothetical protein C5167_050197 [Papaver somniferum]|uniref:Uncharacterized protein n=1 Tax=Papaver somniferum TaxID=3469 RepID=A0A4Y7KRW9_PAPSO|nr:hypothetical protein C5167_050197 [Papaver somniferum]